MRLAYRALAGSHLSRDERLFAAYYSTMREHFVSLARVGVGIAAQATAGLARAAVPVVRPLVAHSAARIVQAGESLASTVNRGVARRVERLSCPDVWVPPRVQIPGRSIETIAATAMSRQLDNMARVVVANREPLRGGLLIYEAFRGLSRYGQRHERLLEIDERVRRWSEGPLGYVTEPLRLGVALELIALVEEAGEAALLDPLERAARDEQVIARLRAAIRELALSDSKRQRLDHALGHVLGGEFVHALDPLIAVVEGLFWLAAKERGVIDERDRFTSASGINGTARGVEKLLTPLGVGGAFYTFVVHRAYGGAGHPFRHGRADEGERKQVLFLILTLSGWLETFAGVPARGWLLGALERELSSGTLVEATLTALDASSRRMKDGPSSG